MIDRAAIDQGSLNLSAPPAEGVMSKNGKGKLAMSVVKLNPHVVFSGARSPTQAEFLAMHHEAHDECFIANSVLADAQLEPTMELAT